MQVADATIATLIERLDNVIQTQSKLEGMLLAQAQQLGAIPVMQVEIREFADKFNRVFNSLRETRSVADGAENRSKFNGTVLKVAGTLLLASFGVIGWSQNQLEEAKERDAAMDRRVLLTEYKLGIKSNVEGGKE